MGGCVYSTNSGTTRVLCIEWRLVVLCANCVCVCLLALVPPNSVVRLWHAIVPLLGFRVRRLFEVSKVSETSSALSNVSTLSGVQRNPKYLRLKVFFMFQLFENGSSLRLSHFIFYHCMPSPSLLLNFQVVEVSKAIRTLSWSSKFDYVMQLSESYKVQRFQKIAYNLLLFWHLAFLPSPLRFRVRRLFNVLMGSETFFCCFKVQRIQKLFLDVPSCSFMNF